MLSQLSSINFLLSGAIAALISGIILLTSNFINNKLQLEREKEQRIWQEKSDQEKWYREKIYDSYKKSLQLLAEIQQEESIYKNKNTVDDYINRHQRFDNLNKLISEFKVEFSIVIANHPNKNSKEFTEKVDTVNKGLKGKFDHILTIIIEIMESDSRIKNIN